MGSDNFHWDLVGRGVREAQEKTRRELVDALARNTKLEAGLRAVLLFHSPSPWDQEKQRLWQEYTGGDDASTKALCDFIRKLEP
jgi:hypothetical protein